MGQKEALEWLQKKQSGTLSTAEKLGFFYPFRTGADILMWVWLVAILGWAFGFPLYLMLIGVIRF